MKHYGIVTALMLALTASLGIAHADEADPRSGYMMSPGMMGNSPQGSPGYGYGGQGMMGPGMMGPGMMGPGMMGPGMMGPGMMGPGMMGPGMMGPGMRGQGMMGPGMRGQGMMGPGMRGQGMMGPGMQGQGMMGPGMRGPYAGGGALQLDDEQQQSITDIMQETRAKHWQKRTQIMDALNAIRQASSGDRPDPDEMDEAYEQLFDLKREMIVDRIEAQNRILDVLNEEQRQQLRRGGYGYRQ